MGLERGRRLEREDWLRLATTTILEMQRLE
jgi:hypothetical protein